MGPPAHARSIVALDCYHNNEAVPHYTWTQTNNGGFSQLAGVIRGLGADTLSIKTAFDSAALSKADILIIVDPDTTTETPSPKYLTATENTAIDRWVQRGGVLMVLTNNLGNCELTRVSELSALFGIRFNPDTYAGGYYLKPLPTHSFFVGCDTVFIKDICTLNLLPPAQSVLKLGGKDLMAISSKGKGTVFALGDPWLYNEYITTADNLAAGKNVIQWLLGKIPNNTAIKTLERTVASRTGKPASDRVFLLNGRSVGGHKDVERGIHSTLTRIRRTTIVVP